MCRWCDLEIEIQDNEELLDSASFVISTPTARAVVVGQNMREIEVLLGAICSEDPQDPEQWAISKTEMMLLGHIRTLACSADEELATNVVGSEVVEERIHPDIEGHEVLKVEVEGTLKDLFEKLDS